MAGASPAVASADAEEIAGAAGVPDAVGWCGVAAGATASLADTSASPSGGEGFLGAADWAAPGGAIAIGHYTG